MTNNQDFDYENYTELLEEDKLDKNNNLECENPTYAQKLTEELEKHNFIYKLLIKIFKSRDKTEFTQTNKQNAI